MGQNVDRAANMGADWQKAQREAQAATDAAMKAALSPQALAKVMSGEWKLSGSVGGVDGVTPYKSNSDGTISIYNASGQHLITKAPPGNGGLFGGISNAIGGVVGGISNVVSDIGKPIESTVNAIAKDPLPMLATIALTSVGVPPAISSMIVSAAGGADLEQIVKTGAIAYAGGQAGKAAGSWTADQVSGTLGKGATQIVSSAASGAASAATGAALTGKDILEAGLTGAIKGGTSSAINVGVKSIGEIIDQQFGTGDQQAAWKEDGWNGKTTGEKVASGLDFALNPVGTLSGWANDTLGLKDGTIRAGLNATTNVANANRQPRYATTRTRSITAGQEPATSAESSSVGFTAQNISSNFDTLGAYTSSNVPFLFEVDNGGTQTAGQKAAAGGKSGSTDRVDKNRLDTLVGGRYNPDAAQGFNNLTFADASQGGSNKWDGFYG